MLPVQSGAFLLIALFTCFVTINLMATLHPEAAGTHDSPANGLYLHSVKELKADTAEATTLYSSNLKVGTATTITKFSTDGTFAGHSDSYCPTEKAVETYVGTKFGYGFFDVPWSGPWGAVVKNMQIIWNRSGNIINFQMQECKDVCTAAANMGCAVNTVPAILRPLSQQSQFIEVTDNGNNTGGMLIINPNGSMTVAMVNGTFTISAFDSGVVGPQVATYALT